MSYTQADKVWEGNNTLGDTREDSARGDKLGRAKVTLEVPAAGIAVGSYETELELPKGAIVREVFYLVDTTFTSATDAAEISWGIEAAEDLMADTAISAAADWDAGTIAAGGVVSSIVPVTWVLCSDTERRKLSYEVKVEDLTAGKLDFWIYWEM